MLRDIARFFISILPKSLLGQMVFLTIMFVIVVEILILIPSVANFRINYLKDRLALAQIISLNMSSRADIEDDVGLQLLEKAGVLNIVLHQNQARQLILQSPVTAIVDKTYDLRAISRWQSVRDAIAQLFESENRYIRVIDRPVQGVGVLIDVNMHTVDLHNAMKKYVRDIMLYSIMIAVSVAFIFFLALRYLFIRPVARLVQNISNYAKKPEDPKLLIHLQAFSNELCEAEAALLFLQTELTTALRQKTRLADLGTAVAKISHDLRNILAVAQILVDGLQHREKDALSDKNGTYPGVENVMPKLMVTITRAVNLCEATLAFGKAAEAPPKLAFYNLKKMVREVADEVKLLSGAYAKKIDFCCVIPRQFDIRCDREQIRRVLFNLFDNARKAGGSGGIKMTISAEEDDEEWRIYVHDTGEGFSEHAQKNLFVAFQGGKTQKGTGLGLAISAELVRGHGGRLELVETSAKGTHFAIILPKKFVDK